MSIVNYIIEKFLFIYYLYFLEMVCNDKNGFLLTSELIVKLLRFFL